MNKRIKIYFAIGIIISLVVGFSISHLFDFLSFSRSINYFSKPPIDYNLFWQVWHLAKSRFVKQPVPNRDLFYGSLKGMISGLNDPYSVFFNPEESKKFRSEIKGTFEGVGIEIGIKKNRLIVIAPLSDTPAERAGIRSGDWIKAINNIDTSSLTLDQAASLIRGKKGTVVTLKILRKGWEEARDFKIVRAKIKIQSVKWEIKKGNIAYIKLSYFNDSTDRDFLAAVNKILAKNPRGIILDLRDNPGGYLKTAVDIAGFWVGEKIVVFSKDAKGNMEEYHGGNHNELGNFKTIVLINHGSASAAEIVAGALQDYKKAVLVGEKTFGKGSVQELINLRDGSAIKITTAYWLTPKKRMINEVGITPDRKIEMTESDYENNRDPQLAEALRLLNE